MRIAAWISFWSCLLVALSAASPALAQTRTPTVSLGGIWKGQLPVQGGNKADLTVTIVPLAGNKYFSALDIPAQKVTRMNVEVAVRGDSVVLYMPQSQARYLSVYKGESKELVGLWVQRGLRAPLVLHHSPMPTAVQTTRLTPPYREEEVVFTNPVSKLKLAGMLTVPAGKGPFPAVVLVSDVGPHNRDGSVGNYHFLGSLADYLTRRGIAVLRYDDRGVGQSEGSTAAATTAALVTDVQAAMNFLRTRLEVKINRIGVVGHGEGANVGLLAAGQPLPPAFVVSMAGYGLPGQQTLLQQLVDHQKAQKISPAAIEASYERQRTMYDIVRQTTPTQAQAIVANMLRQDSTGLDQAAAQKQAARLFTPWKRYFLTFDPIATLDQVNCPVLLLSGTEDLEAPADLHLTALEKELKSVNRAVTSKRLPGLNHLFQLPPTQWRLLNGEMQPVCSPLAQEAVREWIAGLDGGKPQAKK